MTGRIPACSDPRVGFRLANQTSPRWIVTTYPLGKARGRNPPSLPLPTPGLPQRMQRTAWLTGLHPVRASAGDAREISEMPKIQRLGPTQLHLTCQVHGSHVL